MKKKSKRAGHDGKRKERKLGLCQFTCSSLAGFAVLWFWLNEATIWTILEAVVKIIV